MNVPRSLDLGDHDHLEHVAYLGDELGDVIEHPGALQGVDAGPKLRIPEVDLLAYLDQTLASRDLLVDGDRVLEVPEQDVRLLRQVRDLRPHLLVRGVEEVDHPRGLEGDLVRRLGGVDRERLEELSGVSHVRNAIWVAR
jgi:hypothetical protein